MDRQTCQAWFAVVTRFVAPGRGRGFLVAGPAACGREGRAGKVESRSEAGDLRLCFGGASFSGCRKDACGQRHGGRKLDGMWFGVGGRATGTPRAGGPLGRQVENLSYGRPGGRVRGLTARATSEVRETNPGWRGGGPLCPLRWALVRRDTTEWAAKEDVSEYLSSSDPQRSQDFAFINTRRSQPLQG